MSVYRSYKVDSIWIHRISLISKLFLIVLYYLEWLVNSLKSVLNFNNLQLKMQIIYVR